MEVERHSGKSETCRASAVRDVPISYLDHVPRILIQLRESAANLPAANSHHNGILKLADVWQRRQSLNAKSPPKERLPLWQVRHV